MNKLVSLANECRDAWSTALDISLVYSRNNTAPKWRPGLPYWRPGGINDRPTFGTFTCHLIIAFLDELVCIDD